MAFSLSTIFKSKKIKTSSKEIPKIEFKGGTKFAKDNTNDVYLDIEELGGFPFVKTVIIGDFSTKIKRVGCTLSFMFKNESITLNSDNTDLESNKIKNTEIYYTEIDFELSDEEAGKIKTEEIVEIQYTFKKKIYSFELI